MKPSSSTGRREFARRSDRCSSSSLTVMTSVDLEPISARFVCSKLITAEWRGRLGWRPLKRDRKDGFPVCVFNDHGQPGIVIALGGLEFSDNAIGVFAGGLVAREKRAVRIVMLSVGPLDDKKIPPHGSTLQSQLPLPVDPGSPVQARISC